MILRNRVGFGLILTPETIPIAAKLVTIDDPP
jgi:hypothetical protein